MKTNHFLIIGLIITVSVIGVIVYRAGGLDQLLDNRPVAPALNGFDGTIDLYGKKTPVTAAFCVANSTFTPKCDLNTPSCKADWDALLHKFGDHCTTTGTPVTATCEDKYLQVCGSGTGIPVAKSCTDSQYATVEGYLVADAVIKDLGSSLKVSSFDIDRTYSGKPLDLFGWFKENGRITFSLSTKNGALLSKQDVSVDPLKLVGSQEVLWSLDYKLQNADCDSEHLDDNIQVLSVDVIDETGTKVESAQYEVGQKDGSLYTKLIKAEGPHS